MKMWVSASYACQKKRTRSRVLWAGTSVLLNRYAIGIMESENTIQRTVVTSKVKDAVDSMVDLSIWRSSSRVMRGELVDVSAWWNQHNLDVFHTFVELI